MRPRGPEPCRPARSTPDCCGDALGQGRSEDAVLRMRSRTIALRHSLPLREGRSALTRFGEELHLGFRRRLPPPPFRGCGRAGAARPTKRFADGLHGRRNVLRGCGALAFGLQHRNRRIDLHAFGTLGDQNLSDAALIDGFEFHRRLVGLDLRQYVARLDGIAFLDVPFGELALLHGGRKRGHEDLRGHQR